MPELPKRDRIESAIAGALATLFNKQRRELVRRLGDPPKLGGINSALWNSFEAEIVSDLQPRIERIYRQASRNLFTDPDVPISDRQKDEDFVDLDFDTVFDSAEVFASKRAKEVAALIVKNARERVEKVVKENKDKAAIVGIGALLIGMLGPSHAERAAITETTNAVSAGEIETIAKVDTIERLRIEDLNQSAIESRKSLKVAEAAQKQAKEDLKAIEEKDKKEAARRRVRKTDDEVKKKQREAEKSEAAFEKAEANRILILWVTDRFDEVRVAVVCPICKPLHRREIFAIRSDELTSGHDDNISPPAHEFCRCWVVVKRGSIEKKFATTRQARLHVAEIFEKTQEQLAEAISA